MPFFKVSLLALLLLPLDGAHFSVLFAQKNSDSANSSRKLTPDEIRKSQHYFAYLYKARRLEKAGKTEESIALYEKALNYARQEFPFLVVGTLQEIAPVYTKTKDYRKARDAWQEVLVSQVKEHGQESAKVANTRWKISELDLLSELNKQELAELEHAAQQYARGVLLDRKKKYNEAMPLAREALQVRQRILGDNHIDTAISLRNVGWLIAMLGNESGADEYYEKAFKIFLNLLGPNHRHTTHSAKNIASLNSNLARIATERNEFDTALRHTQKVLNIRNEVYDKDHYLVKDAELQCVDAKRMLDANEDFRRKFKRALTQQIEVSRLSRSGKHQEANELAVAMVEHSSNLLGDHPLTTKAISWLGSTNLKLAKYQDALVHHKSSLEMKRRVYGTLHPETAISMVNVAFALQKTQVWAEAEQAFVEYLKLIKEIHGESHESVADAYLALGDLQLLRAKHSDSQSHFLRAHQILRDLYPRNAIRASLIRPSPKTIRCQIGLAVTDDYLRGPTQAKSWFDAARKSAEEIYGRLVENKNSVQRSPIFNGKRPIWRPLPGTAQEVAEISRIWNHPETLTYLDRSIATEKKVRDELPKSRYAHLSTHGYFATAPPRSSGRLGADDSHSTIAHQRTDQAFATSFRNPLLLSSIVLAGANHDPEMDQDGIPKDDDGYLTAEEVVDLDLSQVELVVLAACDTGLGNVMDGEGVFGLQRALHMAGTRSVIASLWKVDDKATEVMMQRFYSKLWNAKFSKLDALREVQLWLLRHPDELETVGVKGARTRGEIRKLKPSKNEGTHSEQTAPFYWAAFQLSGDWR